MASTKVSAATNTATVTDDSRFLVAHTDDEGSSYSTKSITRENLFKDVPATVVVGTASTTTTDYSEVELTNLSPSSFNQTYDRQSTGFVLDTGTVASTNALFHADSNYYYYVASTGSGANGRALIWSVEDNKWVVIFDMSGNFTEGNVSNNDAVGSVFTDDVTATSQTQDSRNVPQASSDIVFATSSSGGSTLTNAADDSAAASAGVAVNQLYRNGSVVMIRVS